MIAGKADKEPSGKNEASVRNMLCVILNQRSAIDNGQLHIHTTFNR